MKPEPIRRPRARQIDDITNLILAIGIVGTVWLCTAGMIMLYFYGKQVPGEFVAVTGTVYGALGTAYYGVRKQNQPETPKPEET